MDPISCEGIHQTTMSLLLLLSHGALTLKGLKKRMLAFPLRPEKRLWPFLILFILFLYLIEDIILILLFFPSTG
jgi:hypothetical protein